MNQAKALVGMSVDGRSITVNLARPREEGRRPGVYGADGFKAPKRADVGYGNGATAVVVTNALASSKESAQPVFFVRTRR
jgi:hypothetical protein